MVDRIGRKAGGAGDQDAAGRHPFEENGTTPARMIPINCRHIQRRRDELQSRGRQNCAALRRDDAEDLPRIGSAATAELHVSTSVCNYGWRGRLGWG